jgi:NitT/TauT family transport system ATP-binding protein
MDGTAKVSVAATTPQLEIAGLVKRFPVRGKPEGILALDGINLHVHPGEFVLLLGPSGCGKSTLLNVIAGFLKPTEGHVFHEGQEVMRPDRRRTVVFQDYALFPWMTVQKNVEFGLKTQGMPAKERAELAKHFIDLVHLSGFEDRFPHEISGGMKQRAAIARALAPNPDILLMDEPFGALDAQTRVLLQEEVARISAETKKTVLFVTHSIEEAVFLGDRIVVMSARPGRIRAEYTVPIDRPRTPETRSLPAFVTLAQDLWHTLKPEWRDDETKEDIIENDS